MPKLIVSMLGLLTLAASATRADDLMDVYKVAVVKDPQIAAAEAARLSALETVPQARALLLPNVNATADYTWNSTKTRFNTSSLISSLSGGRQSFTVGGFSLSVTQPVYQPEAYPQLRQADARVSQANAEFAAARQDLMVRVSLAYFNLLSAIDDLKFARANKEAVGRQLEQTKQRFEVGLIAITDVHEAQARYDLTVATEIQAENALSDAREALRAVTGQYYEQVAPLTEEAPLVAPEPADSDRWAETALKQNLALESVRHQTEIAREQIAVQRAGHYPRLDLVGTVSYVDSGGGQFGGSKADDEAIGLQLSVPIFQGGAVSSRVRQAEHDYTQSTDLLEQQRRATELDARNAYRGVISNISRVKALQQAVVSNRSSLQATEAGYQVGTRTIVDVLNAQQQLILAERDYSQSRYDYILQTLRLKQAAGQLSEADLEQVNGWLK